MSEISRKYLLFEVDEEYALELDKVLEIIELCEVTRVPEAPDYVAGIINLRGNVVPVIDVRKRFRKPAREGVVSRCIVICSIGDNRLGMIVDNVIDLIEIDPENLQDPPQLGSNYIHVFVKNIGLSASEPDRMQLIVDTDKLVNYDDLHYFDERPGLEKPGIMKPVEQTDPT